MPRQRQLRPGVASSRARTVQGRAFQEMAGEFRAANAAVLGVSFDTVATNKEFAASESLSFPLRIRRRSEQCLNSVDRPGRGVPSR